MWYLELLARFPGTPRAKRSRKNDAEFDVRCPLHDDRRASGVLTVSHGRARFHCRVCRGGVPNSLWFARVCRATGTEAKDWFEPGAARPGHRRRKPMKQQDVYKYERADGTVAFEIVRFLADEGQKEFRPRRPRGPADEGLVAVNAGGGYADWVWAGPMSEDEWLLYNLPQLVRRTDEPAFVCEGERDADSINAIGMLATCAPFGAMHWTFRHSDNLFGRRVVVCQDNDYAGRCFSTAVIGGLLTGHQPPAGLRLLDFPSEREHFDVTDFLLRAVNYPPTNTGYVRFAEIVRDNEPLVKLARTTLAAAAAKAPLWKRS